jgi:hypothetical protein
MSDTPFADYRGLMIAALILALVGWPGLLLLLNGTLPTVGPRWLFFFLCTIAVTGTSLPFIWVLHRRFRRNDPFPAVVLLRQGLLVGLYGDLCLWLQINRSLTLPLALLLAAGLALFEGFLNLIYRTSRRPRA